MEHPRNPMDLIRSRQIRGLDRILRACGADEACITGGASDYDGFLALAEAIPLCEGHPLRAEIRDILRTTTHLDAPLCPHTAPAFWEAWTEIHWYGGEASTKHLPSVCPCCGVVEPEFLAREQLAHLPHPLEVTPRDMGGWTKKMESAFADSGLHPSITLPDDFVFTRPDPYHVGEVLRLLRDGGTPTPTQRDLLYPQALRVWGQTACKQRWQGRLCLLGGQGGEVVRLLEYLQSAKALTEIRWFPRDVSEAGLVSGLYACVGTGVDLSACSNDQQKQEKIACYAAVAPLGRAVILQ